MKDRNGQLDPSGQPDPERRITFVTDDAPEKVLAYYEDVLSKDGWRASHWDDQPDNVINYLWSSGGPVYGFEVTVNGTSANRTEVQLKLLISIPE